MKCGGGVGVCRKTAAANDFAAAVFLYKYMRMCKADTIQIKVSFYTYTTVKPVAGEAKESVSNKVKQKIFSGGKIEMSKLKLKAKILACALCVMVATGCGTAPSSGNTVSSPAVSAASSTSQSEAGTEKAQQAVELPHSDKFVVADGAVVFTDKLGRDVSISQKPQRVIILDYNALDLWYHAGGTAVGRTGHILVDSRADEDEMGSEIKNVPIMNEAHDPVNIEMIVAQEPDLIIISPTNKTHLEAVESFEQYNIPYFAWDYDDFDGFIENLELFTLLNDRGDLYEKYASDNIIRVNAVREKISGQEPVTMVMLLPHATNGIYALANSGYLGNLCEDMNLENIAGVETSTVVSIESLLDIDPEWIFSRGGSGDGSEANAKAIFESYPLWSELTAVKEGRFQHLPAELFLYHANTRYADAYEYLANLVYPQIFN